MALSKQEKEQRLTERRKKKWHETHILINGIDHKLCNKCNEYIPATVDYFYPNKKNGIDGLYPYCIKCGIEIAAEWNKENRELVLIYKRKNNKTPKAIEDQKNNSNKWRKSGRASEHQKKNKEWWNAYNRERRKRKHHDITVNEWESCKKYFDNSCAYCGLHISEHFNPFKGEMRWTDFHKEHVDHFGENDLSNCVPSCQSCNSRKRTKGYDSWYNRNNERFSEERHSRITVWLDHDYKQFKITVKD